MAGCDRGGRRVEEGFGGSLWKDAQLRVAVDLAVAAISRETGSIEFVGQSGFLIRLQHWRPAHFRVAADDINYRRFFNINELAGIRMEVPEVFEHAHRLVFRLVREGSLQGLANRPYRRTIQSQAIFGTTSRRFGESFYIVVEKILSAHETLREDWPVDGTTGYEFCAQLTALLVDAAAEPALTRFYRGIYWRAASFHEIVRESKIRIMENELGSELEALRESCGARGEAGPLRTTDFTRHILRRALRRSSPVFRCIALMWTMGPKEEDERYIHWAVAQARSMKRKWTRVCLSFWRDC